MPPTTSDLRAWPENCLSSLRSEKQSPTTSTRPSTWCGPGLNTGLASLIRNWSGPTSCTARCCVGSVGLMSLIRLKNSMPLWPRQTISYAAVEALSPGYFTLWQGAAPAQPLGKQASAPHRPPSAAERGSMTRRRPLGTAPPKQLGN
ncbi:hypothetical protein SBV1_350009 [Verrucomicrobia bacterium]|nr:hypothetical protein SBV1_350009 [Verrucomicrobiota bacterium]